MVSREGSLLWPGVPLALAAAALFGATAPLAKLLLGEIDPQLLAGLFYLGAGVALAAFRVGRVALGLAAPDAPLRAADVPWLAAIVLFGGVLAPLLLLLGLARMDAAAASLLLNLEGLFTIGIAWPVFGENLDRRLLAGVLAILAGAALASWRGHGVEPGVGAALLAGACLAWGMDNNLTRKLAAADPVAIAMIKGLAAGAVNTGLAALGGAAAPCAGIAAAAAIVGSLGIGVSLVLFVLALRHLGAARTSAYFSLAPFIGAVLAIGLLGEAASVNLALAGLLMGVGLWLHFAERHDHEHEHEPLEHEHRHWHDSHHQHAHDGPVTEPHTHWHRHAPLRHAHPHYPDLHHRHSHRPQAP
jgi:drug/metabolite transporter (DMT)-like permease